MDVTIPSVGESVTEGTIGRWFVKSGDYVNKDEPLFELDSDKASMEVTAETSGLVKIILEAGETADVGTKVAEIDEAAKKSARSNAGASKKKEAPKKTAASAKEKEQNEMTKQETISKEVGSKALQSSNEDLDDLTPSQRRAVRSGKTSKASIQPKVFGEAAGEEAVRTPMSRIRKKIAERLMESQQSTATLTTFNELDMSHLLKLRTSLKEKFQKKHGVKLGFMSFFSKACFYAMKEYPIVNWHIDGEDVVESPDVQLGIAVSTERGLVVPVVKKANQLSYAEIEQSIGDLAERARTGKLSIPEMQGGTFTLTNGGVFGSLLSTPILNPPQSGILGMHKTEHRPVAIQGKDGSWTTEVRPMMYLALSYDHRLIDGKTSVGFLVKVKEYLESTVSADDIL